MGGEPSLFNEIGGFTHEGVAERPGAAQRGEEKAKVSSHQCM